MSLARLQVEYLDLYLIHWPGVAKTAKDSESNASQRHESWLALQECRTQVGPASETTIHTYTYTQTREKEDTCLVLPSAANALSTLTAVCNDQLALVPDVSLSVHRASWMQ